MPLSTERIQRDRVASVVARSLLGCPGNMKEADHPRILELALGRMFALIQRATPRARAVVH